MLMSGTEYNYFVDKGKNHKASVCKCGRPGSNGARKRHRMGISRFKRDARMVYQSAELEKALLEPTEHAKKKRIHWWRSIALVFSIGMCRFAGPFAGSLILT
ncbi:hypothetical protein MTO96_006854 [Rhipicephalus appendiculatus]